MKCKHQNEERELRTLKKIVFPIIWKFDEGEFEPKKFQLETPRSVNWATSLLAEHWQYVKLKQPHLSNKL